MPSSARNAPRRADGRFQSSRRSSVTPAYARDSASIRIDRGEGELDNLREQSDCLKKFRARMTESGDVPAEELDAIDTEVMALIEQAVSEAKAAPRPTAEQVTEGVYVNYGAA